MGKSVLGFDELDCFFFTNGFLSCNGFSTGFGYVISCSNSISGTRRHRFCFFRNFFLFINRLFFSTTNGFLDEEFNSNSSISTSSLLLPLSGENSGDIISLSLGLTIKDLLLVLSFNNPASLLWVLSLCSLFGQKSSPPLVFDISYLKAISSDIFACDTSSITIINFYCE